MEYSIGVEIEHTKYIEVLSRSGSLRSPVDLTTIQPQQRRAIIRFFLFRSGRKRKLGELEIGLGRNHPDRPVIRLSSHLEGKRLVADAKAEGRPSVHGEFPFGRLVFPWGLTGGITAAICVLILAGVFLLPRVLTPAASAASAPPRTVQTATPGNRTQSQTQTQSSGQSSSTPAPTPAPSQSDGAQSEAAQSEASQTGTAQAPGSDSTASTQAAPVQDPRVNASTQSVTVYFGAEDDTILPGARDALDAFLRDLSGVQVKALDVFGHASPWGAISNLDLLSTNRARNVTEYLRQHGLAPEDEDVEGLGATQLATQDHDKARFNRRVVVTAYY